MNFVNVDIKFKIATNIREQRMQRNLSQERLAGEAGIDRTYIQSIESGKRNISIEILLKIANALKVNISELLKGIQDEF